MIYRFEANNRIFRFNTDTATLLMSSKVAGGRDQICWREVYRTRGGRYVCITKTLWPWDSPQVSIIEEAEALKMLALAEEEQITPEGEAFLAENDPSEEV